MLQHPNIVPLHELGMTDSGRIYFTMKCIEGDDLVQVLLERPLFELLQILLKVCDAMAFAHSQGVIHRDLKPANIMVGRFGEVQVMDWGLAKILGEPDIAAEESPSEPEPEEEPLDDGLSSTPPRTQVGSVLGTYSYMAPEQARGQIDQFDQRTDIYALGAILYEMLGGSPPYSDQSRDDTLAHLAADEPAPPLPNTPERQVPHELEAVARKAMAPLPTDRYENVPELQRELENYLEGRRVGAARYRLRDLLWLEVKRRRHALLLLASIMFFALLGLGYVVWQRQLAIAEARGVEAQLHPAQLLLDVDRAVAAVPEDPLERQAPTVAQKRHYNELIGHLLQLTDVRGQLSRLAQTTATRRSHFQTLLRLTQIAELSGEFALAESTLRQAFTLGFDQRTVTALMGGLNAAREAERTRNRQAVRALLDRARTGKLEIEGAFRNALIQLSSYRERQTVALLVQELKKLTARLRRATQNALLKANAKNASAGNKQDLLQAIEAWQSAGVPDGKSRLTREQWRLIRTAQNGLERQAHRQTSRNTARPAWLQLLAQAQHAALQQDSRDDRLLELVCGALGYLGDPKGVTDALTDYLHVEWGELRARNAGLALARLTRYAPQAATVLARLAGLEGSSSRWGAESLWWRQVSRELREVGWRDQHGSGKARQPRTARGFLKRGRLRQARGELDKAISDYDQAVKLDPNYARAYSSRANMRQAAGDLSGAIKDYDRAIKLDPKYVNAYNNLGNAQMAAGDLRRAIKNFSHALQLDPKYIRAYNNRGNARKGLGDLSGAIQDYDQAIKLDPQYPMPYNNRGNARRQLGDLSGAISDYDRSLRLDPKYVKAYNNRAIARQGAGDAQGAIADFSQAIRLNPTYVRAYNNRGGARKSFGDLHGALKDYDQAIKLDPKYVKAYYNRANTRRIGGDLQGAIKDYDQAIKLNPKWWPAWLEKGVLLCRKNRRSEGLRALRQAHQLAPKRSRPRIVAQIKRWQAKR